MAGTFKQTRTMPLKWAKDSYVDRYGQGYIDYNSALIPVPTQTTTSFRSGGRYGSSEVEDARELFKQQSEAFKAPYDTGHEFRTEKQIMTTTHPFVDVRGVAAYPLARYRGPLWVSGNLNGTSGYFQSPPEINLQVYGTKAISATRPTKPAAEFTQGLAEIFSEGFPKFVGGSVIMHSFGSDNAKAGVKRGSGEFLNWNFGVMPTTQLLIDMINACINAYPILKQYIRDSEQVVRRQKGFPPIIETSLTEMGQYFGDLIPSRSGGLTAEFGQSRGNHNIATHLHREIWFSGAFTYFVTKSGKDPLSELDRYHQLARRLINTDITVDVLYAVTPWSWLIDWFVDFGDILSNAVAFQNDGLVLRYGYMMCKSIYDKVVTVPSARISGREIGPVSSTYRVIRKERIKATPFGFGLNPSTFSAQQWAILAALGMSKGTNTLR